MNATEAVSKFKELIEDKYIAELLENFRTGKNALIIDFNELLMFDLDLADELLVNPQDTIKAAQAAVFEFETPRNLERFNIRFENIPDGEKIKLRDIRTANIKKLHVFEGVVRQKSDVLPQAIDARFECPSCGNMITILQHDKKFREPTRCGCGRKGKFAMISKNLIDAQNIVLEENIDELDGESKAKKRNVILKEDLVSPWADRKTNPGSKIQVTGIVVEVPIQLRSGGMSVNFDYLIECNYVKSIEDSYDDIAITEKDIAKIEKLSKDPDVFQKLKDSIAPTISGRDQIKKAIVLQLFGGVRKKREDGTIARGDTHILLIGDPGAGKSTFLKRIQKIAPRSRYASGKSTSAAGLTAPVVKDEFTGKWALEAGTLVLANKGFVMLDEMDKMSGEDRNALHEALEQQTVTVNKANILTTLNCEASVLAAANPKEGRFDQYEMIAKQINLPSTLINRFDLIFPLKDRPNKEKDEKTARFILQMRRKKPKIKQPINDELLRKFISYARQNIHPELSKEAEDEIVNYFVSLRNRNRSNKNENDAIPISARQLEGMARLAEASAKTRLSHTVTIEDAKLAIELMHYCLEQIGLDPETGKIDIDRVTSDTSAADRSKLTIIKDIIKDLSTNKRDEVETQSIMKAAFKVGIKDKDADYLLAKLKRTGDIYESKKGFIRRH